VRPPDLRSTREGKSAATLTLAVNRIHRAASGELRQESVFVTVDSWGRHAETLAKSCGKGTPLIIEGRLRAREWTDKATGQHRARLVVALEDFHFTGPAPAQEPAAPADAPGVPARPSTPAPAPAPEPASCFSEWEDDGWDSQETGLYH
jgi:single-strand DNA-binding protein